MIAGDQPNCFFDNLAVIVSSKNDGTMLNRTLGIHDEAAVDNRRSFCTKNDIEYDDVVYQRIEYGHNETFTKIAVVDGSSVTKVRPDVSADALITSESGVGIFLPLADCIGLVLYCPKKRVLAVVHMGRHSTLTNLLRLVVNQLTEFGEVASDIIAWMTPSAGKQSYRLDYFAASNDPEWQGFYTKEADRIYIDLAGYNKQQLLRAGLVEGNIHTSQIDTVKSKDYFSHSAGERGGRFAVLAMMR